MKLEKTKFGSIIIDGQTFNHDVYVISKEDNYEVMNRKKELSYKIKGHTCFGEREAEFLLSFKPEVFFIGKGQFGVLPIPETTRTLLDSFKGEVIEDISPKILMQINQAMVEKKKLVALIHITC